MSEKENKGTDNAGEDKNAGDSGQEQAQKQGMTIQKKIGTMISDAVNGTETVKFIKEATEGLSGLDAVLMGTGAATLKLGAAAVEVGGMAVSSAVEMQSAMDGYLASTGKSQEETDRYQAVLEEIYGNNFGESFADIAQAMAEVNHQMGDMPDESLQAVTESAFTLKDLFGYDIAESAHTAQEIIDNFGVDGQTAFSLIAKGAQNGLDDSGELLSCISEYSEPFAQLGLDADNMFQIFENGAETGAYGISEAGAAVGEMAQRVAEGSESAREGFETLGLNADEMTEKFAMGGESAREAFQQTMEALAGMEDPLAQNAAGVDLFGSQWAAMGEGAAGALSGIGEQAYATAEDMNALMEVNGDDLGAMMEELQRNLELLLIPLGEALMPILNLLIETVLPLVGDAIMPVIKLLGELISIAIEPLMAILTPLCAVFSEVMSNICNLVETRIGKVTEIFKDLIRFVRDIFSGNWKDAMEAVGRIFRNVFECLPDFFKRPINFIIDGINKFITGINRIKIPDWVPGVGGKSINLPLINRLKEGWDFIPTDFYPAYLDYGERVLTREQNRSFASLGGIQGMERALSPQPADERKLVLKKGSIVVSASIDGKAAASVMAPYMDLELGSRNSIEGRN